ncbi:MAG: SIMPL domain-containing protein [Waterburya sp.]
MEVTNEAIFKEINFKENPPDNSSAKSSVLKNTTDPSLLDLLTGASSTAPLVGNFSRDLLIGNVTPTQTDTSRILEVTGKGVVSVDTNTAQVQVGIEVEGATASEVQQEVAQTSSAVVEQLNQLEVEELQTISISLKPKLEFDDQGNSTVVGFAGRNVLQFEIPTEQAGETIDAAIQAGANLIENIDFIAPESELNQARLDAIKLAAQDAQNQAIPLLNTLDLTPLEIVDIDILEVSSPSPRSFSPEFNVAAFDASTPIIGGSQEVVANVALDINYAAL